jgi:hypothetical protein
MHDLYKLFYNMCCNSNKKANKEIKNFLFMRSVRRKNENKTFMNVFDITKKCYKLACMELYFCAKSTFLQDLMKSSLNITKWYQV